MRSTWPRAVFGSLAGIEKGVLERGGAAVDNENLFRPFALEAQPVRVFALAECSRRFGRSALYT